MPGSLPRVHLHIGLPKTGTTYLQEVLWHNRSTAAAAGLLYPGYVHSAHFQASIDLQPGHYPDWHEPLVAGAWDRLAEQVRAWPGTSVISSELLATATEEQIDRALNSLSSAEVHIVCTARDLARQIPSMWQENVRNRHVEGFAEFLAAIRGEQDSPLHDLFWRYQDLPRVLGRWAARVPADRVHVVTLPHRGGSEAVLWQRFTSVLGVEVSDLDTAPRYDNRGLGATDTEVLRRLNVALPSEVGWPQYASVVKEYLAMKILPRPGRHTRITLPAADRAWVTDRAEAFVTHLTEAGYDLVGDLDELRPAAPPGSCVNAANAFVPSDGEMLDVAVDALAQLVRQMPANPDRDRPGERFKHSLREFSEAHPPVMALRELYWKSKAQMSWARGSNRRRPRS
ncbi:MAG TPA: hypothetical protein VG756_22440 [Pseudonocardiaceae bacterium]|nr:hypothetical protein [Pseudonocardiaceae bacterium]